MGIVIFVNIQ